MAKVGRFRWVMVVLCFLMCMVNYLDRSALSFFAAPIMKEFHLTNADFGLIGSSFAIGYFIFTFVGGWLTDKMGPRKLFLGTGFIWGLVTIAVTMVTNFWGVFISRTLLGTAEGPAYPLQVKVFNNWLPQGERTTALAYSIPVGVSASLFIGGPLAALIFSTTHQWKAMFIIVGILSFLLAFIWYAVLRDRPEDSRWVSKEELAVIKAGTVQGNATSHKDEGNSGITIGAMCKDGTLLSTYIGFFALGYIFWFALTWLPGYLQQDHHLTVSYSALLTSLPWIGYGIGSLAAGYLSDYSFRKTKSLNVKKHLIWISLLLSGLLLIPAFLSDNLMVDVIFITLAITASGLCVPPLWALNSDVVPKRSGTSSGIMDAAFALAGLLAPAISGFLVQSTHSFVLPFVLNTVICLVGAVIVMVLSKPDKSMKKFSEIRPEEFHSDDMTLSPEM